MFEDSTFESTGSIRTHSRTWMMAAFFFNGSILLTLVSLPLIYPEALPRQMLTMLFEAPAPPPQPAPAVEHEVSHASAEHELQDGHIFAPPKIPTSITEGTRLGPEPGNTIPGLEEAVTAPGVPGALLPSQWKPPVVLPAVKGPIHVSAGVVAGLLVEKTPPIYPAIAKAMRVEGIVVLEASISRSGTIENLRVVSGPAILQQAALDAVSHWRYRPYLLNGEPVEVETTVNVIFSFGH